MLQFEPLPRLYGIKTENASKVCCVLGSNLFPDSMGLRQTVVERTQFGICSNLFPDSMGLRLSSNAGLRN